MPRRFPTRWITALACAAMAAAASMAPSLARGEGDTPPPAAVAAPPTAAAAAPPTAGAATPAAASAPEPGDIVDQEPFDETTTVKGKIETNLQGVWLLVAMGEVAKGKYKNFPQLLHVTKGKQGLEFHLLDVRWPESVNRSLLEAKQTLAAWVPSEETLKLLSQDWSHLPTIKQKARDEFLFFKINYLVASPKDYSEAFSQRSDYINKALDNSKLAIKIVEDYRPRPASTKFHGAQVMRRTSYYGAKTITPNGIKGDSITGFVAAGAGTPLPLDFLGTFAMYRLASK